MARILIVEDDKYLNKLISDRLMLEGHNVTSLLDGESACEALEKSFSTDDPFEILISDMLLPRMMGAEIFAKINQIDMPRRIKIIAMSGVYKNPQEIKDLCALYNIQNYLVKPFSISELLNSLDPTKPNENKSDWLEPGLLVEHSIEALLMEAYTKGFTGKLVLQRTGVERRVYFLNGFPVSADSTSIGESLGKSLVSIGVIDEATSAEASRLMVEEKMQFGQTLIKMGKLTKDELFHALRKHTYRLLLNMFLWRDGNFKFEPATELPKHILPLEFNPLLLIMKAHKGMFKADFILSLFSTKLDQYCSCDSRIGQLLPLLNLDSGSLQFFKTLPGDQTLENIVSKIDSKRHEDLFRILYLFECSQLVKWSATAVVNNISDIPHLDFRKVFEAEKKLPSEVSKSIHAEYMDMLNKDHFELFNIEPSAEEKELDDAYRSLRYRLHPDRFGEIFGGETKRVLDDMLSRIDSAYQTLSDETSKAEYLKTIKKWKEDSLADSKHFLDAQDKFRDGLQFLNRANFEKALDCFRSAEKIWNRGIEYTLYSLYCEFKMSQGKDPSIVENKLLQLKSAANNHKSSDIGYLLLGHAYISLDKIDLAKEAYRAALKNNERNDEAANSLQRLGDADLKKARVSGAIKTHSNLIKQLGAVVVTIVLLGVVYSQRKIWFKREAGIVKLSSDDISNILPAIMIRQKNNIAKITVKEKWLSKVPDPVLQGKCTEAITRLKRHGIIELWLYEDQGKLRASCRNNTLRRYK